MKKKYNIILFLASEKGVIFLKSLLKQKIHNNIFIILKKEDIWERKYNFKMINMIKKNIIFYDNKQSYKKKITKIFQNNDIDFLFAVGWRHRISKNFYQNSKIGSFIIHDSFLPKNRGCAPLNWSLINGDNFTGVSLIEMKEEIDGGDIILQKKIKILEKEDIVSLHKKILIFYKIFVINFFKNFTNLIQNKKRQNIKNSSYNRKRFPKDGIIDWTKKGSVLINFIKALKKPWPGAFSIYKKKILFIWDAKFEKKKIDQRTIGNIHKSQKAFYCNCKDGRISIKKYSIKKISPYLRKVYL